MASNIDNEEKFMDEYYGQDEDDLGDFIVDSDEDNDESLKQKQHRREDLDDEVEEEVEEYEEVEEDEEVEEEDEDAPVGQQMILSLREKLKQEIRRKNAAMAASAGNPSLSFSENQTIPPAKDRYGTFFGPSKPVLARRVIEEGCSSIMKELPYRKDVNLVSKAQPGAVKNVQKPKFVSEEKTKIETLRENRDYSCLFADDADTQPTTKETQVHAPLNSAERTRMPTSQPARLAPKDHGLKSSPAIVQAQSKAGSLGREAHAGRKRMAAPGRNGSNSNLMPNMKKKTPGSALSSNVQKLQPSLQSKRQQVSIPGQRLLQESQSRRPQGNGSQPSLQGRRPDPSVQGQHIRQKGSAELHGRLKSAQKQIVSSWKRKASRPVEKRAVKTEPDDEATLQMRRMFSRYRQRFAGIDDKDDRNMEADFASIQKEERRSATLARKEDEEQLRLIEEEERRERTVKRKKAAH